MTSSRSAPRRAPRSAPPLFTVVVPTRDRPTSLEACLRALAAQEIGREHFEVVVVDDGSAASPRVVVARAAAASSLDVRLIEQANAGPAAARNAGARAARGEYLAFTDDDCLPDPRWLAALAAAIDAHPRCAVGGRVVNALGDRICSAASQLLIEFLYDYYADHNPSGRFFITSNLALPRATFAALGGFDTTFPLAAAEDRDLCERWHERGEAMVYADDAIVRHAHDLTLPSFVRQHFNYGRGAHYLHGARARRGQQGRRRLEPLRFYWRLVGYPSARATGTRAAALSSLALLSQVAYASGYFTERARARGGRRGRRLAGGDGVVEDRQRPAAS